MKLYNYVILIARGRDPTSGLSGVNRVCSECVCVDTDTRFQIDNDERQRCRLDYVRSSVDREQRFEDFGLGN